MAPGRKTGGRKKGSKNKRKAVAELMSDVVVQAAQSGETPLEYMLRVMRDPKQKDNRRDEMAKAAAPYVHARLAAAQIEHAEKPSEPVSAEELRQEILANLAALGISLYDDEPTGVVAQDRSNPELRRRRRARDDQLLLGHVRGDARARATGQASSTPACVTRSQA
jgi:hypothetical protein